MPIKTTKSNKFGNISSNGSYKVGFKEPIVSYHAENDPFLNSNEDYNYKKDDVIDDRSSILKQSHMSEPATYSIRNSLLNQSELDLSSLQTRELNANVSLNLSYKQSSPNKKGLTQAGFAQIKTNMGYDVADGDNKTEFDEHKNLWTNDSLNETSSILEKSMSLRTFDMSKKKNLIQSNSDVFSKLKDTIRKQKAVRFHHDEDVVRVTNIEEERAKVRKVAICPPAPRYKGFNTANTRLRAPDGKVWKEDVEKSRLSHTRMYKPEQQPDSPAKAASTLFTSTRTSKPSFRSNISSSFAKKRTKPTRKTGKLTSENHSFKTTIITPSSWKESKVKVKVALNGSKTTKPVSNQEESKLTSSNRGPGEDEVNTCTDQTVDESKLESKTEEVDEDTKLTSSKSESSKASERRKVMMKQLEEDLKRSSSDNETEKTDSKKRLAVFDRSTTRSIPLKKVQSQSLKDLEEKPVLKSGRSYDQMQVKRYIAQQKSLRRRRQLETAQKKKEAEERKKEMLNQLDERQREARKKQLVAKARKPKPTEPATTATFSKSNDKLSSTFAGCSDGVVAFVEKLDRLRNMTSEAPKVNDEAQGEGVRVKKKFMEELDRCLNDGSTNTNLSFHSQAKYDDNVVTAMTSSLHKLQQTYQPWAASTPNLSPSHLSKQAPVASSNCEQIAAIKAKSESLQKRIEAESQRLLLGLYNTSTGNKLNPTNSSLPWKPSDQKMEKVESSEKLDSKLDELLRFNSNKSADSNSQSEASIYSDVSLPGYKSPLPGVGGLTDHVVENMMKKIEEEANERVSRKKRSPQSEISTSWRQQKDDSSKTNLLPHFSVPNHLWEGRDVHDSAPIKPQTTNKWKDGVGDKYSVANLFTRKYLRDLHSSDDKSASKRKNVHSNSPSNKPPTRKRSKNKPTTPPKLPSRDSDVTSTFSSSTMSSISAFRTNTAKKLFNHKSPPTSKPSYYLGTAVEEDQSSSDSWSRPPDVTSPIMTSLVNVDDAMGTSSGRYSPNTLANRLKLELGRFENIDEAMTRLMDAERATRDPIKRHLVDNNNRDTSSRADVTASSRHNFSASSGGSSVITRDVITEEDGKKSRSEMMTSRRSSSTQAITSQSFSIQQPSENRSISEVINSRPQDSASEHRSGSDVSTSTIYTEYKTEGDDDMIEESRKAVLPFETHRRSRRKTNSTSCDLSCSSDDAASLLNTKSDLQPPEEQSSPTSLFTESDLGSFNHFMDAAVSRYINEQQVRSQHQTMLLQLREKAVKEKAETELIWLEQKRRQLRNKGEDDKMPPLAKKKRAILRRLQVEKEEIKKLKAANEAASKDQKLIIKQHQALSKCRKDTKILKEKLKNNTDVSSLIEIESRSASSAANLPLTDGASVVESSEASNPSETAAILKRLTKVNMSGGRHLTLREKNLLKRKKVAERLLEWKKELDEEEKKVSCMELQAFSALSNKDSQSCLSMKNKSSNDTEATNDVNDAASTTDSETTITMSESSIVEEVETATSNTSSSSLLIKDTSRSQGNIDYSEDFQQTDELKTEEVEEDKGTGDPANQRSLKSTNRPLPPQPTDHPQTTDQPQSTKPLPIKSRDSEASKARETVSEATTCWSDDSFSQTQSEAEQSDVECRVRALKEELRQRRLVAEKLKKQQKKRHKEDLRAQELSLKNQIEVYDAFIIRTQQELDQEIDASLMTSHSSIKPQIRSPRKTEAVASTSSARSPRNASLRTVTSSPDHVMPKAHDVITASKSSRTLKFDDVTASDTSEIKEVLMTSSSRDESSQARAVSNTSSPALIPNLLPNKPKDVVSPTTPPSVYSTDGFDSTASSDDTSSNTSSTTSFSPFNSTIKQSEPASKLPLVTSSDDGDKTPVVSPQQTPTPSSTHRVKDMTSEDISIEAEITSPPKNLNLVLDDDDSAPEDDRNLMIKMQEEEQNLKMKKSDEISENIFTDLLQEAFLSTVDIRNSTSAKQATSSLPQTVDKPSSGEAPKLSSSAKSLLQMITSSSEDLKDENKTLRNEKSADDLTDQLIEDTISQVMKIRKSQQQKWSKSQYVPDVVSGDVDHGDEIATILKIKNSSQDLEQQPTFHRPVSPIFGASQDDNPEDWFYDFEEFQTPPNFGEKPDPLGESASWKDEKSRKARELTSLRFDPPPILVPHQFDEIMELVERGIDFYYDKLRASQQNIENVQIESEGSDEDQRATNRCFKLSVLHLVRDLTSQIFESFSAPSESIWSQSRGPRRPSFCRVQPTSKEELAEVVRQEVARLFRFDRKLRQQRRSEENRPSHLKSSIASKKRDRVDHILNEELRDEEAGWIEYGEDETNVKLQLAEIIFEKILADTVQCFDEIEQRRQRRLQGNHDAHSDGGLASVGSDEDRSHL